MRFSKLTHMPHQLAERGRQAASQARGREAPEAHDCAACGLVGAGCFGFGGLPSSEHALWACEDLDCREVVERMAAERAVPAVSAARRSPPPESDLFARAAP